MFQIYGQLTPDQISLERKLLRDIVRIDWKEVFVTLKGSIIQLPISVKIPIRNRYRFRCIMRKRSLLHVMLRQGTSWYALDNMEYLLPPPSDDDSEILIAENRQAK